MQPSDHVHSLLWQRGQGEVLPVSTIAQKNVSFFQGIEEAAQQPQVMIFPASHRHAQDRAAAETKEDQELEQWETAAGLLAGGLRIAFLVLFSIWHLGG